MDKDMHGQPIEQGTELNGWDGVKIYAGKVTYTQDDKGNASIAEDGLDINAGYSLKYSEYANMDDKSESDWGLMVSSPNDRQEWEINVSKDGETSEAVVFDLGGKLAYGVSIDFGAFYLGGEDAEWDHVSERALVTFYRDGKIVGSTEVHGKSENGKYTLDSSDVVLGGFDKVVISSLDNSTEEYADENSDFTIQGIDFITKSDDPVGISEGTVAAESGADGFAKEYQETNVKFDLEGMVQESSLNEEGTSGTITVLIDDVSKEVTLELIEGSSGESILTGTIQGTTDQLFTATLDQDGHWTMEHYEQFQVLEEDGSLSSNFELAFKTEDADGDIASATVDVPLEVKEQDTNSYGNPIGNDNDIITIIGNEGDGVAGTIVAGDTGGMTEGQQVEANYNVCFILDTSGSMNDPVSNENTRFNTAINSINNFVKESIHKGDFVGTVQLSIVPFAGSSNKEDCVYVTINREINSDGKYEETYSLNWKNHKFENNGTYKDFDSFSQDFIDCLDKLSVNGGTNYEAGFRNAAKWFEEMDTVRADGNITYFLTDGEPTANNSYQPSGNGSHSYEGDVKGAWDGYQELLKSAPGMQVNAIGFGGKKENWWDTGLSEEAMKTLAMFDNTATPVDGVEANEAANGFLYYDNGKWSPSDIQTVYTEYDGTPSYEWGDETTYYTKLSDGSYKKLSWEYQGYWPDGEYELGYRDWGWHKADNFYTLEELPIFIPNGNATQVTDGQSLTAAFTNGFKPGTLDGAGNDTITATESTSSVVVFGDVMNTDQLLHDLKDLGKELNDAAPLPDYGSGKEVFEWLEANGSNLVGTKFEGWTHDDSIKYMLQHAEELGYETRVDGDGTPYLVTTNGTVLELDDTEAQGVTLDSLTRRDGGSDTIIGSSASDTIYGQEDNDLLIGDPSDNLDDLKGVTVSGIESMKADETQFENFLSRVEGTEDNGDDMLFGGTGDDVLIGMGGDDYLNGGEGSDAIFGGSGNDIIVYDQNDYMVSGGSGIDFMVTNEDVDLDYLLTESGRDDNGGPIVDGIEVLIKGRDALDLTNMEQLAKEYGISINDNGDLELDASKWTGEDGIFTNQDANLTLETTLTQQTSSQNETLDQQVIILQHSNS